jgi:hypothetical protein
MQYHVAQTIHLRIKESNFKDTFTFIYWSNAMEYVLVYLARMLKNK